MSRAREGLRPIDLARAVGVSTQQIRNYEDAGILPPVPRTASGYRRFDTRHRQALLTYRALAKGFGPDCARKVMRAVHAGDVPEALALLDAGHAAQHDQRVALRAMGAALEAVAEQTADTSTVPRAGLRIGEAAAYLGVRPSALRVWESAGLLNPARDRGTRYRRFHAAEIRAAQMIKMLRQSRYGLAQIKPILEGLRRTGSSDALRAAITQRRQGLARQAAAMLEGSSHLHRYLVDHGIAPRHDGAAPEDEVLSYLG